MTRSGYLTGYCFAAAAALALGTVPAPAQQADMTFFVTSVGSGKGADLGGLEGADRHCTTLATAAGATGKTWRAYLSTQGANAVNAKDRIGRGPWQNAKGTVVAKDVADLHGASNNLNKQTALNEKGEVINGRGDTPNRHDILTGSQSDGTAFAGADDRTILELYTIDEAADAGTDLNLLDRLEPTGELVPVGDGPFDRLRHRHQRRRRGCLRLRLLVAAGERKREQHADGCAAASCKAAKRTAIGLGRCTRILRSVSRTHFRLPKNLECCN